MLQTVSITIKGKVQGVYYRQSTKHRALELSVTGMVGNMPDGSVQVLATGTPEQLENLVHWCRQGPPRAIVTSVEVKELPLKLFEHFTIQHF